ncbi:hypothetical protein [Microcoleus sp. bin38.metabat.b11b12b14.051]|uniref:hypothetical protein n=1 Tax=Microcoleus sp. bin38.metabat.b11b12b14.051 TaxID=2742709 RepID=UPI0025D41C86|nr:hypothetical protein [Microcoleus sp. bin38.metabat.b11b12b14.051]
MIPENERFRIFGNASRSRQLSSAIAITVFAITVYSNSVTAAGAQQSHSTRAIDLPNLDRRKILQFEILDWRLGIGDWG